MNNSERLDQAIDSAFQELQKQCGKQRDDYYGLIFMESILGLPRSEALAKVAFGGHDFGVDGFHFDDEQGAFRIFQFKNSASSKLFVDSLKQLERKGVPALFGDLEETPDFQPIVNLARKDIGRFQRSINQVCIDFVFRGDPSEAEQSALISDLKARLVDKNWMLDKYFGEHVPLLVRFLPFDGISPRLSVKDYFLVRLDNVIEIPGPGNLKMHVGYVPLVDLYGISSVLGRKFLERNIRYALPPEGHVNRSLSDTFASIALKQSEEPSLFAFHHNGVTLSAGKIEKKEKGMVLYGPRLLNGAQTIHTFKDFWERNAPALRSAESDERIGAMKVLCRIVVEGSPEEITDITVSNNRQNPVHAWQLHANDPIQLELEDWFRNEGFPYQRQDRAFAKVSAEEWQAMAIDYRETKAIEMVRLAQVFLTVEGDLSKRSKIREVFENKADYERVFSKERLNADPRRVILCYKAHFRLGRLADEIAEKGPTKYAFVNRTKEIIGGLVCQGMLNDPKIEDLCDSFGHDLTVQIDFTNRLRELASTRVRFLLNDLIEDAEYADRIADGNFNFMRSNEAFEKAMRKAKSRWGWKKVLLK